MLNRPQSPFGGRPQGAIGATGGGLPQAHTAGQIQAQSQPQGGGGFSFGGQTPFSFLQALNPQPTQVSFPPNGLGYTPQGGFTNPYLGSQIGANQGGAGAGAGAGQGGLAGLNIPDKPYDLVSGIDPTKGPGAVSQYGQQAQLQNILNALFGLGSPVGMNPFGGAGGGERGGVGFGVPGGKGSF